ncbi:MAG TPA: S41 family peptidase, partial [Thermoanaerobaculaceae bacterium]|nr:S41 family peptidase [Thermoanaerobaculaceae bacterium]
DGRILYATRHFSTLPNTELATVDPRTGERTLLPLAQASDGTYDPTGRTLFFTRLPAQGSRTKRYQGGTAQNIWAFSAAGAEAVPLTGDFPGTSKTPMWWHGRIYFASDRDGAMNLWSMDEHGGDLKQHTRHTRFDVQSPAMEGGRIVYQLGADVRLYDVAADRDALVPISLATDFDQLRERWLEKPMEYLTAAHLAPKGDRLVLTARGQVFVAPVKQGRLVEVTRSSGVRYRQAHFMPDGNTLVALSDESGEVEWWRLPANGAGTSEQLTRDGHVLRFDGVPSPDGAWIASYDKNLVLWLYNIAEKRTVKVASSRHGGFSDLAWSPDSKWLAYVASASNTFDQITLYCVADGTMTPLTDDRTESGSPAWSPDGKWIYFLSDRYLHSAVGSPWGLRQPEPFFAKPTKLYAVALARGVRFPFEPADELHPETADKGGDGKKDEAKKEPARGAAVVTIDRDGLASRLYEVPVAPGDYEALSAGADRLFFLSHEVGDSGGARLYALAITNKEPKAKTLIEDVRSYELSADGKKILVHKGDTLAVFDAPSEKVELADAAVDLKAWRFPIQPREEFRQMFREAWRLERDYFYDRGMNGVDWPAMLARYQPLVDRVADRAELADLLAQMVSELSALHMFVYGGDIRKGRDAVAPASLGAVLERDATAGGLRVAHIYRGDADYPDRLAPLARPGVDVREGDVIEAINGVAALSVPDAAVLLRDAADRQALLRVRPAAGGPSRDVIVTPITPEKEADLRYDEWELTRRRHVEELGKGRIGYVHLRAMGGGNYAEWAREFYPVFDRAGLIVDVRHNRGGNIDSWILEKLLRKAWFYWQPRVGDPTWNMQYAFRGHAVVLVDQNTASDGEAFAEGFRRLGIGKVIGARTWGGEIWLSSSNFLVDKGIATAAETGVHGPEGQWLIEGHGVDPDIAVDDLPAATFKGGDAQLDEAIRVLEEEIRDHPVPVPPPPAYPDKSAKPPRGTAGTS